METRGRGEGGMSREVKNKRERGGRRGGKRERNKMKEGQEVIGR